MDTICDEDWTDMKDDYEYNADTFDKEGRPIGSFTFGPWNIWKFAVTGKMPRLLRYLDKLLEEVTQGVIRQQLLGKNVTQWEALINLEGFNLIQHGCPLCLPAYAAFVSSYEEHYPGFGDELIFINTPPAFQVVLQLVRPIFSPQTQRAMKVLGQDKRQWMTYLDKVISKDERRPEFGGNKLD